MKSREQKIIAFLEACGKSVAERKPIVGDASFRRYERIFHEDTSYILMDAPPEHEDIAPFIAIQNFYEEIGLSAPRIYGEDRKEGFLLLEDLGNASFTRLIHEKPEQEYKMYEAALDTLVHSYKAGFTNHAPSNVYDAVLLAQEIAICIEWFLPLCVEPIRVKPIADALEEAMANCYRNIIQTPDYIVHRDYHADNLFWLEERKGVKRVGLLDFQDAVRGRIAYDAVSLLEDARRDVSKELAEHCKQYLVKAAGLDQKTFEEEYAFFGAQRNAKILGIFARLYLRDGKPHYLSMIPRVWAHFLNDIKHPALEDLQKWLKQSMTEEEIKLILQGNVERKALKLKAS